MFKKLGAIYRLGHSDSLNMYDAFKLQIVNRLAVLCWGSRCFGLDQSCFSKPYRYSD